MQIDVLTLFPGIFTSPLQESLLKKAIDKGLVTIDIHDIRSWCHDKHKTADDTPYGGGPGMVMKAEPLFAAIEYIKSLRTSTRVIYLSPKGKVLNQKLAKELALCPSLTLLCGRYEGIDERVRETLLDDEISIGDYVLNGGELPALVLIETVTRLIPGVVGDQDSIVQDSFYEENLLDCPHYTKPLEFRGMKVPDVLLSGHHAKIEEWRRKMSLLHTRLQRPELIDLNRMSRKDRELLREDEITLKPKTKAETNEC